MIFYILFFIHRSWALALFPLFHCVVYNLQIYMYRFILVFSCLYVLVLLAILITVFEELPIGLCDFFASSPGYVNVYLPK